MGIYAETVRVTTAVHPGSNSQPVNDHICADTLKDEYNFDSQRITTDYYEYEQGQTNIIVKRSFKTTHPILAFHLGR